MSQLVQSLDEAPALAGEATVGRGAAGAPRHGAGADPHLDPEPVRAGAPAGCSRGSPTGSPRPTRRRCCASCARPSPRRSRRWWRCAAGSSCTQTVPGLGETVAHTDPAVRLASVQALAQLGTPAALGVHREGARGRRPRRPPGGGARRSAARGYKGAQRRVEAVVLGQGRQARWTSPRRWRSSRRTARSPGAAATQAAERAPAAARACCA